jgi:hypothetical protein
METPVNTETRTEPDLDQIIEELDRSGSELPVAAIRAAQQHREPITPRLIEALRSAVSEAQKGASPTGNAYFFALFLLTEFQVKEAWPVILEAISLPGYLPDDLFGDAISEMLPRVFVAMIGDRLDVIDELIRNRNLNEFVRWSAARVYVYLLASARLTRDEAVPRLRRLLSEAIETEDLDVTAPLVRVLTDLGAREAREEIEKAFQLELVDESVIDLNDVENIFAVDESAVPELLFQGIEGPILDTVAELEDWAAFQETQSNEFDEFADNDQFDDEALDSLDESFSQRFRSPIDWPLARRPIVDEPAGSRGEVVEQQGTVRHSGPRVGRNDPCPCGSGKKYKKCCGGRK